MWGGDGRGERAASCELLLASPFPPQPSVQAEAAPKRQTSGLTGSRGGVRNLASPVRTVLSAKPPPSKIRRQLCSSDASFGTSGQSRRQPVASPRQSSCVSLSQPESSMSRSGPMTHTSPALLISHCTALRPPVPLVANAIRAMPSSGASGFVWRWARISWHEAGN